MTRESVSRYRCDFCSYIQDNPKPGTWAEYRVYKTLNGYPSDDATAFTVCRKCFDATIDQANKGLLQRWLGRGKR